MGFLRNFINGDNDELLFFILVFLFLFSGNLFGPCGEETALFGNSTLLFFIIVFLFLFFNSDSPCDT